MSRPPSTKRNIIGACAVIAVLGAGAGGWNYRTRDQEIRAELLVDARRSTVAFEPAELVRLAGAAEDLGTPAYLVVKDRLRRLKVINPRVRFVYLFRLKPDTGKVVYLADSADPGARDESLPGREYKEAATSPGLQTILRTGRPATEGPLQDEYGTWITAYATIGEVAPSQASTGRVPDVLGVDMDAAGWRRELWRAAFEGAFYVWLALGLPLIAWFVARRQLAQRDVIHNLSEAMEQSHSAILIVGLDGRIQFANRGLCEQLGYARVELLGRSWQDFQVVDAADHVLNDLGAVMQSGRPWEGEWLNRRQNGTVYPVRGMITPVKQRDGALACFVVVFDDATGAKDREAELREARDLAQAGDRAKGHFLATMSHEVRTPLNGIVGFTSLLLDTPLNPEQREYVQTIRMSTEALIQLTGDILDFARIESGKLKLDPLTCDPRECVEDALDLLAPKADAKRIELLHRVGDDVPAAVMADGGRLRQVLANLIGNAIKFTDRGEVEVSIRRLPISDEAGTTSGATETCMLEFSVRDTGIGIARENHSKLFRAFSQIDDSTTRRYGGTGLGLAICRNLVELMGGTIGLESEPAKGSIFRFTIRAPIAARVPPARNLVGLRLGLVVPTPGLRREIAELVRGWHADVLEADDPNAFNETAADIVLVEVGEDAARALAARPAPLYGLTSDKLFGLVPITLSNELRTGLRAHFRLLVNKPVHHDGFFALLAGSMGSLPAPRPLARFGYRVLLVDDDAVNQLLVERVLSGLGCTSTLVNSGPEALELLRRRSEEFDLVLIDLHMPRMDGLATLRELRAGKAGVHAQGMWVIALTADARAEQRARGMSEGLNDYLTKPLKPADLEVALRTFRAHRAAGTAS